MRLPPKLRWRAQRARAVLEDPSPRLFFRASPALQAFRRDEAKRQCVLAANRVGKTYHAVEKMAQRMIERPGYRARVVGPTDKQVTRVHAEYLYGFLKAHLASGCTYKRGIGFNRHNLIVLGNGSTCELLNYKQDPDAHASSSLDLVVLDEPPPRWAFVEAEARVFDRDGEVWVTLTAVGRPTGWLREIVEEGIAERLEGGEGWSFYQVALSVQNCPWYTPKQVERRIREVGRTPWEYAQRIEGAWDGVTEGRWFVGYSDKSVAHTRTPLQEFPLPRQPVQVVLSVDHGDAPGNSVWLAFGLQVVRRTRWGIELVVRVLGEYSNPKRQGAAEEIAAVAEMLGDVHPELNFVNVDWCVGDTNIAAKNNDGARLLNDVYELEIGRWLHARGLCGPGETPVLFRRAKKGPGTIPAGVALANQLLQTPVVHRDLTWPAVTVHESCAKLHAALSHWAGADDDLKHWADAFRYGVRAILDDHGWKPSQAVAA